MQQTVVSVTFGAVRNHSVSDAVSALKHQLGLLVLETRGHTQLDIARSLLATAALSHGADVVVFIDHDMKFDPIDVERLASVARETRGVVGAPYSQRRMGARMVGAPSPDIAEMVFFEGGQLYPASGVIGMGFTAIHRTAFEALDPLPEYAERMTSDGVLRPYFQKLVVDGYWLHEDASFCHAVQRQGVRTDLDTRIRVQHLGEHPFDIEDCRRVQGLLPTMKLRLKRSES